MSIAVPILQMMKQAQNLPEFTQLISGRIRIQTQILTPKTTRWPAMM